MNLNYVPWMTLLGIVGAGIGYLVGGGSSEPDAIVPALYGLCIGSFAGVLVRVVLRTRTAKKPTGENP